MLKGIDHVGIVVDNLKDAQDFVIQLGMTFDHEIDLGRTHAVFYRCGSAMIELIDVREPTARAKRLGNDPARIEHVAIEVDDLARTVVQLSSLGVHMKASEPFRVGATLNNWTTPESCDGVMYQFVEHETPSPSEMSPPSSPEGNG